MIDRIGRLVAVAAVVLVLLFGWWADQQASDADDRAASEEIAREALAAQVEQLGGDPVVPPGENTEPGDVIVVTEPGPQGVQGPQGRPGRNGEDGTACLPTNPACVGPQGATGDPGGTGPAGEPGVSGSVGPQGEPGPAGQPGAAGVGIADVEIVENPERECHLIVTLTDGTSIDAGQVDCPTPPLVPLP